MPAHKLGEVAIRAALGDAQVDGGEVSEVILGQVLTAAQGQNPARQASLAAGLPMGIPAWGINQLCGSGLRAVGSPAVEVTGLVKRYGRTTAVDGLSLVVPVGSVVALLGRLRI